MTESEKSQYDQSGVSSTGAETALSGLLKHVLPTRRFSDRYPLAADIGYFANVIDLGNGEGIAFGTDGVGTKIIVAELLNRYDTIGIDCVAMNVNDVICVGARPVSMVDYIGCSHTDPKVFAQLGQGLAEGARQSSISISHRLRRSSLVLILSVPASVTFLSIKSIREKISNLAI